MQTRIRRLVYRIKHSMSRDAMIFAGATLVCLLCVYGAISAMSRNWDMEREVAQAQQELDLLQIEVQTIALENQYYASEEYQELAARAKANKKFEGEFLVYLPPNSDKAVHRHDNDKKSQQQEEKQESNFSQWLSFLFGI